MPAAPVLDRAEWQRAVTWLAGSRRRHDHALERRDERSLSGTFVCSGSPPLWCDGVVVSNQGGYRTKGVSTYKLGHVESRTWLHTEPWAGVGAAYGTMPTDSLNITSDAHMCTVVASANTTALAWAARWCT